MCGRVCRFVFAGWCAVCVLWYAYYSYVRGREKERGRLYWASSAAQPAGPTAETLTGFEPMSWDAAEEKANRTLEQMTQEEKFGMVRGVGWDLPGNSFFNPGTGFYVGNTQAVPRLGVPALRMQDAANGFRTFDDIVGGTVTAYPSMLCLAATWDDGLVRRTAAAIAREFRGKGANILLGPSIQVHRTAWGGRNFEYLSGDDPYLGSRLARAYVGGVQGEGVMAVAKHWAFNEQETNRNFNNVEVDARTAWELYYPPFEAAIEAGVCAVMCAYNRVNGTHACTNDELLTRDLKGVLGFRGFVQSDWWATYGYRQAIEHGLDQTMPGNDGTWNDYTLRRRDPLALDGAVRRLLTAIYRMRLDDDPGCDLPECWTPRKSQQRTPAHRALAAEAAAASVTLLKNDGVLPLTRERAGRIVVAGTAADAACEMGDSFPGGVHPGCSFYCGGGSGFVFPGSVVTPWEAISKRALQAGVVPVLFGATANGSDIMEAARDADVVVVVVGHSAAEGIDRVNLSLADGADDLIFALAELKPTVVLMQTPGAVLMPWLGKVAAVANLFLAGEETGNAWAPMLFGDTSPQGKLPIQFPEAVEDTIPPNPSLTFRYSEGLFTSYRNPAVRAAFPFGHGLSYTTFDFGAPRAVRGSECRAAAACLALNVTNAGGRPGTEVVQAYLEFVSAPRTPKRMLRGYHKTRLLQPGESEDVAFQFSPRDLSLYSVEAGWVVQDHIRAHVGASSADIRQTFLFPRGGDGERLFEL